MGEETEDLMKSNCSRVRNGQKVGWCTVLPACVFVWLVTYNSLFQIMCTVYTNYYGCDHLVRWRRIPGRDCGLRTKSFHQRGNMYASIDVYLKVSKSQSPFPVLSRILITFNRQLSQLSCVERGAGHDVAIGMGASFHSPRQRSSSTDCHVNPVDTSVML